MQGDGTVPSFASVPIEWNDTADAHALPGKHAALQIEESALDSIFNWMQPVNVRGTKGGVASEAKGIELTVPATLAAGDDLVVRLASLQPVPLTVEIEHVESGRRVGRQALTPGDDGAREVVFPAPLAGVHRVRAIPRDPLLPGVADNVLVFER
jgi:hypothetical protein